MKLLILEEYCEHSGYDWTDRKVIALSESKERLLKLADEIKTESKDYIGKYKQIIYSRLRPNEQSLKITELRNSYQLLSKYSIFSEIDGSERNFVIDEMETI